MVLIFFFLLHLSNPARLAIFLTTWHLTFATIMTQILARFTGLLDGRRKVKMTGRVYLRAIVPIGVFFSLSLICGNVTYLYLSVPFIQMLKVRSIPFHPANTVLLGWTLTGLIIGHHPRRHPHVLVGIPSRAR